MDAGILALLIPIVAILGVFGTKALKIYLQHERDLAAIRSQNGRNGSADIESLRKELQEYREIGSKYDLSLQQLLENLDQRVEHLETRLRQNNAAIQTQSNEQRITR